MTRWLGAPSFGELIGIVSLADNAKDNIRDLSVVLSNRLPISRH